MSPFTMVIDAAIQLGYRDISFVPVRDIKRGLVTEGTMTLYRVKSHDVIIGHVLLIPGREPMVILNYDLEV